MSRTYMNSNGSRLDREFFARPTLEVARDLLGMRLVRVARGRRLAGTVVEVEAYVGTGDSACHASRGRTRRNAVMFGPPGRAYVYFTYGMHWLLNVVTEVEGFPAAILIRALEPEEGLEEMRRRRSGCRDRDLASGPGRVCRALGVDGDLYGADMVEGREIFFERGVPPAREQIESTARVGIHYARKGDIEAPWRFFLKGSPHVSAGKPSVTGKEPPARRKRPLRAPPALDRDQDVKRGRTLK